MDRRKSLPAIMVVARLLASPKHVGLQRQALDRPAGDEGSVIPSTQGQIGEPFVTRDVRACCAT